MKELIKKWLGIDEKTLYQYIDRKTESRVGKNYAKLKRADKERYKELKARIELLENK